MRQVGKKGKEWIRARAKLIKNAVAEGRITINEAGNISGRCEDCKKWKHLSPDHKTKRSQGGKHEAKNIAWLCSRCHFIADNTTMSKKKSKKPAWAIRHKCVKCKFESALYICPNCGEESMKK